MVLRRAMSRLAEHAAVVEMRNVDESTFRSFVLEQFMEERTALRRRNSRKTRLFT